MFDPADGPIRAWRPRWTRAVLALLCTAPLSACHVVGPASIRNGRGAYRAAISHTNEQQALESIVRLRYGESIAMLSVASVTASMSFASRVGAEVGIGPAQNYDGNLVPLSAGVAYEENPTISYAPIDGGRYVRSLFSPLPLDVFLLLVNATPDPGLFFRMLTDRINNLRNPVYQEAEAVHSTEPFERLVEIFSKLDRLGFVDWAIREDGQLAVVVHGYAPDHVEEVRELASLLDLPDETNLTEDLVLPVYLGIGTPALGALAVKTRSIFELMKLAAVSIEVPPAHVESGLALDHAELTANGRLLRVRSSASRPENATVAIEYRDHWFYIEATDQTSRTAFLLFQTLVSARIADAGDAGQKAPLLTVPVSR